MLPPKSSARSGQASTSAPEIAGDCETSRLRYKPMAHQINLSSRELGVVYQNVLNANGIDWALFTYDKGSNDLKVQSTGDGGLDELRDEFSDGR